MSRFCFVMSLLLAATPVFADDEPGAKKSPANGKPRNSVDDELRKSLDEELFKDLPAATAGKKHDPAKRTLEKKSPSPVDRQLLDDLNEGEDVELGKPADPLTRIGRRMRTVELRIDEKDTSASTQQLQREIVTDLEALIQQLQQQCNKSGKSGSASQSKSAASTSQTSRRQPKDSTERLDKSTSRTDGFTEVQKLVKEVWGQMPERVREQISNVTSDQFLPQYQRMIEDYYRRLAEDSGK